MSELLSRLSTHASFGTRCCLRPPQNPWKQGVFGGFRAMADARTQENLLFHSFSDSPLLTSLYLRVSEKGSLRSCVRRTRNTPNSTWFSEDFGGRKPFF